MIIVAQVKVGSDWREVDEQCDNVGARVIIYVKCKIINNLDFNHQLK